MLKGRVLIIVINDIVYKFLLLLLFEFKCCYFEIDLYIVSSDDKFDFIV